MAKISFRSDIQPKTSLRHETRTAISQDQQAKEKPEQRRNLKTNGRCGSKSLASRPIQWLVSTMSLKLHPPSCLKMPWYMHLFNR